MERIIAKQEILKLTCEEYQKMMSSDVSVKEYLSKEYYENKGYRLIDVKPYDNMQFYNFYYLTTYTTIDIDELEKIEFENWKKGFQTKEVKQTYDNPCLKLGDIINIKEGHKIRTNIIECMLYNNPQHGNLYMTTLTSTRVIEARVNPTGIFSYLQGNYKITDITKIQERYDKYMGYLPSETIIEAIKIDNSEILISFSVDSSLRLDNNDIRTLIKENKEG